MLTRSASPAAKTRRTCPAARRAARRSRARSRRCPDILLLDEPTNHLDLTTIEWLERELDGRRAALVMISHDRRFLSNLSRSTVWLDRGETRQRPARLRRLRGLARRGAGRGGAQPAQARPQDRRRRTLAALRRHRAAKAQRQAARQPARASRDAAQPSRPCRRRRHHRERS